MLPDRLVVPYDRGPFEARFSEWQPYRDVAIARRVDSKYRDETSVRTARITPAPASLFAPPATPRDSSFDPTVAALVPVRRAPNVASGARGHSFVQASVNGQAAGWWLLDSGADGMLIDERLAYQLGMPVLGESRSIGADGRPRRATWRKGRSFTVGRLTFRDPLFLAVDMGEATAPPGERRSGVIGYDAFAHAVIEYARDGDELLICDPLTYQAPQGVHWTTLDFIDQTPAVRTRIEGNRQGLFQIDTGAAGTVDFYLQFIEANGLLEGRPTREVQSSGAGGSFSMRTGRLAWIDLGGIRFTNQEVGFRTAAGRDGAGFDWTRTDATLSDYIRLFTAPDCLRTYARTGPIPSAMSLAAAMHEPFNPKGCESAAAAPCLQRF